MSDSDVTFTADERAYLDTGDESKLAAPSQEEAPQASDEPEIDLGDEPAAKEAEKQDEKQKFVPHQALHAERLKRQEIERQLNEQRQQFARFEQRMAELNEVIAPKQAPPDPVQDPIAALQYTQQQLADMQKAQVEVQQRQMAEQQQQALIGQVEGAYKQSWQAKLSESPDTANAYKAFVSALDGHFQLRGVQDPSQRQALIVEEERAIAYAALQQGIDPAEAVIKQAAFYGYRPEAAKPAVDPAKALENKQKGLAAARSLSTASGASSDGALTPQRIAEMSSEEFAALKSKLSPSKFAKLMGGA